MRSAALARSKLSPCARSPCTRFRLPSPLLKASSTAVFSPTVVLLCTSACPRAATGDATRKKRDGVDVGGGGVRGGVETPLLPSVGVVSRAAAKGGVAKRGPTADSCSDEAGRAGGSSLPLPTPPVSTSSPDACSEARRCVVGSALREENFSDSGGSTSCRARC